MPHQHDHIHHLHDLTTVHYDIEHHDGYPDHHHTWGGTQFNTVDDHDHYADDHDIVTGDDFEHPGYDVHFS